jgi:hypothetical protein
MLDQKDTPPADNTVASGNNDTSLRMVPESDVQAVKRSLEAKVAEAETKVNEHAEALKQAQIDLDQERVGRKSAEERVQQVDALTVERDEAKTVADKAQSDYAKLLETNLETARTTLIRDYKLSPDKVNTMSLEQTALLIDTLPTPNNHIPTPNNIDMSGNGGGTENLSARDRLRRALDNER